MIETTNLTNTAYDLERYRDADDVRAFLRTFSLDGLEVMPWGENTLSFLPPDAVPGLHLGYFPCWVDFYRGQEEPVLREFGSMQAAYDRFGGETPEAIVEFFRRYKIADKAFKRTYPSAKPFPIASSTRTRRSSTLPPRC